MRLPQLGQEFIGSMDFQIPESQQLAACAVLGSCTSVGFNVLQGTRRHLRPVAAPFSTCRLLIISTFCPSLVSQGNIAELHQHSNCIVVH